MANHPLQGQSFNRSIIIGLGSTGLKVLQAFQDLWFERFSKVSNSLVKLINIETDENNLTRASQSGSMIEQIFVNMGDQKYSEIVKNITIQGNPFQGKNNSVPWEWNEISSLPWNSIVGFAGKSGAGGIRAGGKVLLWGKNSSDPNSSSTATELQKTINNTIRNWIPLVDNVSKIGICQDLGYNNNLWIQNDLNLNANGRFVSNSNPNFYSDYNIYITGSLTGGTCSGMFLDIAYLIKNILAGSIRETIGLFALPPTTNRFDNIGVSVDKDSAYSNTFGSLYELKKEMYKYLNLNIANIKGSFPYDNVYLAAPEYNDNNGQFFFDSLDGLVEMFALRLFCCTLGIQNEIQAKLVDGKTIVTSAFLHGFGIGAILYPKFTLIQTAKNELMSNFCSRLIDVKNYINSANQIRGMSEQENNIKEDARIKVDDYSKKIFGMLKSNPPNSRSTDIVVKGWIDKLNNKTFVKQQFINEFLVNSGFFYSNIQANIEKTESKIKDDIEKDLITDFANTTNLIYISNKLNDLIKEFDGIKKLLELQEVSDFNNTLNKEVGYLVSEFKRKKSIDKNEYISSLMLLIYDKFVLFYQFQIINKIAVILNGYLKDVNTEINNFSNAKVKYGKEYKNFNIRLNDNSRYSPVVKVFFISKDADYAALKSSLPGKQTIGEDIYPGWGSFSPEMTPEKFFKDLLGHSQNLLDESSEEIRTKLSLAIRQYLHPVGKQQFSIINQINAGIEIPKIDSNFKQIDLGFLKLNSNAAPIIDNCRFVISNDTSANINTIIKKYGLKAIPVSNPLIEDMVVFSPDKLDISLDSLDNFDPLKNSFINKPPQIDSYSNTDWTKLRLVYNEDPVVGLVDYTLIESKKKTKIENILKFIQYFWFDRKLVKGVLKFGINAKQFYNIPQTYQVNKLKFGNEGLYILNTNEIYLGFISAQAGTQYLIPVINTSKKDYNALCKHTNAADSLFNFFKSYLILNPNVDRDNFVANLDKYYQTVILKSINQTDTAMVRTEIFGPFYNGVGNFDISITNNNCLISNIIRDLI